MYVCYQIKYIPKFSSLFPLHHFFDDLVLFEVDDFFSAFGSSFISSLSDDFLEDLAETSGSSFFSFFVDLDGFCGLAASTIP